MTMWILGGVALAAAFVRFASAGDAARERRVLGMGLVVAALLYVVFTWVGAAGPVWLELSGAVVFAGLAWAGACRWPFLLAVGWLGHAAWDGGLHLLGPGYGPEWYAALCVGFDAWIAGVVVVRRPVLAGWEDTVAVVEV